MPSPILARADALMNRKRPGATEFDDIPVLTDAIDDLDIPVLTDSEPMAALTAEPVPPVAATTTPPSPLPAPQLEHWAEELARRVELRLQAELPRLIESTLRDFLAEQQMLAQQASNNS